jgi:hypothetical protein
MPAFGEAGKDNGKLNAVRNQEKRKGLLLSDGQVGEQVIATASHLFTECLFLTGVLEIAKLCFFCN